MNKTHHTTEQVTYIYMLVQGRLGSLEKRCALNFKFRRA